MISAETVVGILVIAAIIFMVFRGKKTPPQPQPPEPEKPTPPQQEQKK